MNVDLNLYMKFVNAVTSNESQTIDYLKPRIDKLAYNEEIPVNVALLLTAAIGLGSETGEFQEIVKKIMFQGKDLNQESVFHMKRELGDVMWYWINACRALDLDPNDVINENVKKLESRYPGGKFDVFYSENRKTNDL